MRFPWLNGLGPWYWKVGLAYTESYRIKKSKVLRNGTGPICESSFFGFLKQRTESVEAAFPQNAPVVDPFFHQRKSLRFDLASPHPACLFRADELALFKYLQVLHDAR